MIYDLIAPIYDAVNKDIDYSAWADFIEETTKKFSATKPELVLDLACGTGKMALELAARGYDMTGIDYSVEMLEHATEASVKAGLDILWLCQDMTDFELYGTVDLCVCCLDSINHLTKKSELVNCFSLVHNYLVPDGLFIFDINGKYKFENVYADRSYILEERGDVCVWQNSYNEKSRNCDFYITLFKRVKDGRYERYDECQREKMYTLRQISSALKEASLEFIGAYSDFDFTPADDSAERIYIVAKCKK